jgi:hypothetical protein
MTKHSWTRVSLGALALAVVCALAWWAYKETQRRSWAERGRVVQDSTTRLREAPGC